MVIRVFVSGYKGERLTLDLCDTEEQFRRLTVCDLRRKIGEKLPSNTDLDRVFIIFADERLNDDSKLLYEYGIQHWSVLQITIRVAGGGGPEVREDKEGGNMGDRDGKNISMDCLSNFKRV